MQRVGAGLIALRTARTHPQAPVRVTVSAVVDLTPSMRRITFTGCDFPARGRDQYARLLLPRSGQLVLPSTARWYPELLAMDVAVRPWLRNYTLRAVRPGSVDVDFHFYDGSGPAVSWARVAAVGDEVGLIEQGAPFVPSGAPLLVVADDTGMPAALSILAERPDAVAVLEVDHPQPSPCPVMWVSRGEVPAAVAALDVPPGQAWVAGEGELATGVRRQLVARGWAKSAISFSGYYRQGRPQYR
ncbi:MAG: siderophore-interacting protein [Frankiales bacterium]|nr:siderophore-interacting protein [Frankiales bacterium]